MIDLDKESRKLKIGDVFREKDDNKIMFSITKIEKEHSLDRDCDNWIYIRSENGNPITDRVRAWYVIERCEREKITVEFT